MALKGNPECQPMLVELKARVTCSPGSPAGRVVGTPSRRGTGRPRFPGSRGGGLSMPCYSRMRLGSLERGYTQGDSFITSYWNDRGTGKFYSFVNGTDSLSILLQSEVSRFEKQEKKYRIPFPYACFKIDRHPHSDSQRDTWKLSITNCRA